MIRDILGVERNFAALSTKDLLDARDQYHWHLIHKKNVVGTAIGLYYIRTGDVDPTELTNAYIDAGGGKSKALTSALFRDFGVATGKVMADGTVTLAMLWESAWQVAEAEGKFSASELGPVNKNSLRSLYEKTDFLPSLDLAHIDPELH